MLNKERGFDFECKSYSNVGFRQDGDLFLKRLLSELAGVAQ